MVQGERGTLIFWDPVIQRALTDQSALQWICSAKVAFGRIYDLCLIAKVGEGWYLSDHKQTPGAFAYPVNIRFALDPEIYYDKDIAVISPLKRKIIAEEKITPFRRKLYFTQRLEIPFGKEKLSGCILYDVFKNEVSQPAARTHFSILLKE
jgi:hypothetical protein